MRYFLLGFDCLLLDDGYTRREIDLGLPFRNHREAAADAKRLNHRLVLRSDFLAKLHSSVSRRFDQKESSGGRFGRPRAATAPLNGSGFSCCSFRLGDSAARRFCRHCCHRHCSLAKTRGLRSPKRLQAASRHLSDTGLPGQPGTGSISAVPEKAILRKMAPAEPTTGSLAGLTPARDRYL